MNGSIIYQLEWIWWVEQTKLDFATSNDIIIDVKKEAISNMSLKGSKVKGVWIDISKVTYKLNVKR